MIVFLLSAMYIFGLLAFVYFLIELAFNQEMNKDSWL